MLSKIPSGADLRQTSLQLNNFNLGDPLKNCSTLIRAYEPAADAMAIYGQLDRS